MVRRASSLARSIAGSVTAGFVLFVFRMRRPDSVKFRNEFGSGKHDDRCKADWVSGNTRGRQTRRR